MWAFVNIVMKVLLNMGNYMSQELLGSQRGLLNAVTQLGMIGCGDRSWSALDWAVSGG